jgi:hypothetical protein
MAAVYGHSKLVLNASINGDLNMRVFEAMAAGAMLVTNRIGNGLADLFEEGTHYVGYSSTPEAMDRIAHYLDNNDERQAIAHAGQAAVLAHHTYDHRWEVIRRTSSGAQGHSPARDLPALALGELYAAAFLALRQPQRIAQVRRRYGMSGHLARLWLLSWGRWLNARVPLTRNALKARLLGR